MNVRHLALLLALDPARGLRAAPDQPAPPTAPAAAAPALDVVELSAADARPAWRAGTLTARALTEAYLARIAAIDKAGPALQLGDRAEPDGRRPMPSALDAERQAGKVRGPMHGMPVLLKDNIDVVGMVNSAGSLALADNRPATDAFLVTRLREAGAVILGKTNLSEWANFRSTRSSSGWSSRGGQTKHAYVLDRNPCGSSAGTGTAMAASLAARGRRHRDRRQHPVPGGGQRPGGPEADGGLVSRSGIIPISVSQDTAGPMTRTVTDAALLLTVPWPAWTPADPAGAAAARQAAGRLHRAAQGRCAHGQALRRAAAGDGLPPRRRCGDGDGHRHAEGGRRRR